MNRQNRYGIKSLERDFPTDEACKECLHDLFIPRGENGSGKTASGEELEELIEE
jgi:hypothetical protein